MAPAFYGPGIARRHGRRHAGTENRPETGQTDYLRPGADRHRKSAYGRDDTLAGQPQGHNGREAKHGNPEYSWRPGPAGSRAHGHAGTDASGADVELIRFGRFNY